ncbi:MAG: DUF423 domain-containing protein [Isosphaerales bacterium]
MNPGFWLRAGAIWGFLAISMGAFGAHGLKERFLMLGEQPGGFTAERLEASFHTGAQYHMYCALALLAVGVMAETGRGSTALQAAGWSLLLGSLVFSGSLYILAVTGIKRLGAITPIGGVVMLIGWLALAVAAGSSARQ